MAYYFDHKTNLKALNLQFRQKKQRILLINDWLELELQPRSVAEIWTISQAILKTGICHSISQLVSNYAVQ